MRQSTLDAEALQQEAVLIFNPTSGQKLGVSTNTGGGDEVQAALRAVGLPFTPRPTERAGHATELAQRAVDEGRRLVIAAGGDGTVGEVAQALAGTATALGILPLGSIMNIARTLAIPRDLAEAAQVIRAGRVLAMDLGQIGDTYFLEAAGVGLDAALYGYFEQLDTRGIRFGILRAALRYIRNLGTPPVTIEVQQRSYTIRASMITLANGPYVGAAYALAPDARIDDGLLDVVVFRRTSPARVLVHLLAVAGGRPLPAPTNAVTVRVPSLRIVSHGRRPLPVHADGTPIGTTPVDCRIVPAALRVVVGTPAPDCPGAWGAIESSPGA